MVRDNKRLCIIAAVVTSIISCGVGSKFIVGRNYVTALVQIAMLLLKKKHMKTNAAITQICRLSPTSFHRMLPIIEPEY